MSIGWQSGEGAHLWCTGINNRWGVQENTFLSKTHQKLSFYHKYIKKLSFYLKYIKSSKSIINKCQDLLGITKGGRGPLKAIEGLCAMMAPSEWGSGYEPLLRLLFQRDFGRIAPFDDSISSIASVLDWFSHKIFQIRPKGPFSMNRWRICLKRMVVVESRLSNKSISQILRPMCK